MEPCWTFCGKRHLAWLALLSNVVKITIISFLLSLTWMPKALAGGPCPPRCHCNDETKTGNCTYASLDIVPIQLNPELRHLDLSGNQIKGINKVFDFYRYLESLDLHNNMIPTLGSNNFRQQDNLLKLNLSRNSLSTVTKSSLHGLTKLQRLDISNNNISELEEQTFKYTSELEQLDLSGNALTSLPDGLLRNLHRIKWIDLSRNSLLESPASNLALVPSLERLDLSENLIQDLTGSSLPSQPALDQFSLANNVLRSISDDAFDKLPSLLSLDLSGNNLTQVPSNAFSKLSILTTLLLNKNPLGELKNFAFKNLFELKNLELNDCFISSVSSRAFADNVNLERISMDGNRDLNELPDRVLYAAGNLRWVSLRRCNLGSLQPTQFPVDGLSVLRVGGNPLVCNCSLHWLWIVLKAAEERRNSTSGSGGGLELDSSEIVCTDEEFGGKLLAQLPEGSLRCKLDPVYLSLSVIGCLAVSAAILALVARAKKARRLKRTLTYSANQGVVGRPELLVYVGQPGDEITDKSAESYNRRLIGIPGAESPDNNFYEVPRYQRPPQVGKLASDPYGTFYIQQQHLHQQQTQTEQEQEGIYAVADVTSLRGESAEVASFYRKKNVNRQNPSAPIIVPSDYEYGYDYDYDGAPTAATSNKPQVVFV